MPAAHRNDHSRWLEVGLAQVYQTVMTRFHSLLLIAAALFAVCGSSVMAQPVAIQSGMITGARQGSIRVFKGIPYAAPPIGGLRWRAPEPAPVWSGVRKADAFSPICPQVGAYPDDSPAEPMSEDCLTLNLWTPATSAQQRLPVMVWIYGGGLQNGSGSTPLYAGDRLATHGVVVVTFNYRLGALGFLAHPQLNRESGHGGSGNYGLLDQIAALKWVQRNIAAFGGDPNQVTIFGQSSGAMSVSALIASPLAKGLFRRAIAESGGIFEPVALDPLFTPAGAADAGQSFARKAGATNLADLRRLSVANILRVPFHPQFNIDGHVLTRSPYDAYAAGTQNKVDVLLGTNAEEGQYFLDKTNVTVANLREVLGAHFPSWLVRLVGVSSATNNAEARAAAVAFEGDMRFRWDMWVWARHAASADQGKAYLYQFSRRPPFRPGNRNFGLGAAHGAEMPYVFGHLDPETAAWTSRDRGLATAVATYWTNFAKTGNPNGPNLPQWPDFGNARDQVMNLGDVIGPVRIPEEGRLHNIGRVYAVARFIANNVYAVLATALVVIVVIMALVARGIRRRWRRTRSSQ